ALLRPALAGVGVTWDASAEASLPPSEGANSALADTAWLVAAGMAPEAPAGRDGDETVTLADLAVPLHRADTVMNAALGCGHQTLGHRCGPRPCARRLGAMPMTPAHAAYLRHPDVRGDLLTFTAANDVWLAPLAGGRAWRLTDEGAPVGYPRFSPDGAHVASPPRTSGGPEVWVIPTEGDTAPRRLTAWGRPSTKVAGWLPDGRILATSSYGAPIARDAQLWAIDLDGTAELLPLGRSGEVAIHPSGTTVVATPWRRDQASWKHYQGGTAVKLWISREDVPLDGSAEDHAARSWEPLLDEVLASKLRIAWYGDRLLFASDTPGPGAARTDRATANLWSVALDGSDLRVHTSLTSEQGYLREPATDGSTIVFTSRGRLFAMDSLDAEPREVQILASGVGAARLPRQVRPLGRSPFALFVTDAQALTDRERGGVGSDVLGLARLDGGGEEIRFDLGDVGRILHAIPSPDGSKVAISTHDNVVRLVTLRGLTDPAKTSPAPSSSSASAWEQEGESAPEAPRLDHVREVGRSTGGEIADLAWSPDGRWLVWSEPNSWMLSRLMIS